MSVMYTDVLYTIIHDYSIDLNDIFILRYRSFLEMMSVLNSQIILLYFLQNKIHMCN